ncbi:MAG TPA: hypothetical protein V6C81_26650 [Planktothrix sp.]|jgi:hypothetical protein
MSDDFDVIRNRIDKCELLELHDSDTWNSFFEDCLALLSDLAPNTRRHVLGRLMTGVWAEYQQKYRQAGFLPAPTSERLGPILIAVAQLGETAWIDFLRYNSFSDEQKNFVRDWLAANRDVFRFSVGILDFTKLSLKLFPADDWDNARSFLQPLFDDDNALVRAAAAAAWGEMYADDAVNLPPLSSTLIDLKNREIERPGIAGPFLVAIYFENLIDVRDWILEIIAKRKGDEPDMRTYNGIDFYAHEILSADPNAIRQLIAYGAEDVAVMAATEEEHPIEGMKSILEDLVDSNDYLNSRICSWQLANIYGEVHPKATTEGFVQIKEEVDVRILYLFDPKERPERPYAAVIHPQKSPMTDEVAWSWIDKLVPVESRPPMEDNDWMHREPRFTEKEASFVYGPYFINLYGDPNRKFWDRVWVKWPRLV